MFCPHGPFKEAPIFLLGCPTGQLVRLYTDCLSLLLALASTRARSNKVEDLSALYALNSRRHQLRLFHVRGHVGIPGNEVAENLAVRTCAVGEARAVAL